MPDDDYDWADDDSLSAEDTMRIFEGLGPDVEVTGPTEHNPVPPEYRPAASLTFAHVTRTATYPNRTLVPDRTPSTAG